MRRADASADVSKCALFSRTERGPRKTCATQPLSHLSIASNTTVANRSEPNGRATALHYTILHYCSDPHSYVLCTCTVQCITLHIRAGRTFQLSHKESNALLCASQIARVGYRPIAFILCVRPSSQSECTHYCCCKNEAPLYRRPPRVRTERKVVTYITRYFSLE